MPRTARASQGGDCYRAINRGNARAEVFHKDEDYRAIVRLMGEASERLPLRVLGWCLMLNHFHLVLSPHGDDAEVKALRQSVNRGTPFGDDRWKSITAKELGLEFTLRQRGRPRKRSKKENVHFSPTHWDQKAGLIVPAALASR